MNHDSLTSRLLRQLVQAAAHELLPTANLTGEETKNDLLGLLSTKLSPWVILQIGQGLKQIERSPIIANLRSSHDIIDFHDRWGRLEKFGHTKHRTKVINRLKQGESDLLEVKHYCTKGEQVDHTDSIFVWGLLIYLYETAGFKVIIYMRDHDGVKFTIAKNGVATVKPGRPDFIADSILVSCTGTNKAFKSKEEVNTENNVTHAVSSLIRDDPGFGWNTQSVAKSLSLSSRTLQRQLKSEGSTFSKLLASSRIETACHLIKCSPSSLTEIAYYCGFADQAHFTRTFTAICGAPPSAYQELVR